jgi:hypothetical protein
MQAQQSAQQKLLHSLLSPEAKAGLTLSRPDQATVALLTQIVIELKIANGEKVSTSPAAALEPGPDPRRAVFEARATAAAAKANPKPAQRFQRETPKAPTLEEVEAAEALAKARSEAAQAEAAVAELDKPTA